MGVEEEVDRELEETTGQVESCILEGHRYKGKFKARRKGAKCWGGSEYTTHLYIRRWWEGSGTVEDNRNKQKYQFLLHTEDFCDCCFPKYLQNLEGSIIYFHKEYTWRSVAEKPELKDKRAIIDLSLEKLLSQLNKKSEKDPIPTATPQPLEILELMGRDLIQSASLEEIIDSVYFNLEKISEVEDKMGGFGDELWLECLNQSYTYNFRGYVVNRNNERIAFLKISPDNNGLPIIIKNINDLDTLGTSFVYLPLDTETYKQIKKREFYDLGELIIRNHQNKFRNQQLFLIGQNLFRGQLVNQNKKVFVLGEPIHEYKLDKTYDGKIVPSLIKSISQKIKIRKS